MLALVCLDKVDLTSDWCVTPPLIVDNSYTVCGHRSEAFPRLPVRNL